LIGYMIRRFVQALVVMIGVTIIAFVLRDLLPGTLAGDLLGPRATAAQLHTFNVENGLNRPLPVQYLKFLDQLVLHHNLGYSFKQNQSVDAIIVHNVPRDGVLLGISFVISVLVAIPIGILQAVRRNRGGDYAGTAFAFFMYAIPDFLLGLILVAILAVKFRVFPPEAPTANTITGVLSDFKALVLPIVTEILVGYAGFSRYMRSSAIDSLSQDYVRTARAKGLSERAVLRRHIVRNSLIPMATLIGLSIPVIFTSGLLIEYVFNFQGLGLEFYQSSVVGDYPVTIGITVFIAALTVLGNLLADVAYAVLDPRVRYS
jgi:peptide/nickel transport system permease protein